MRLYMMIVLTIAAQILPPDVAKLLAECGRAMVEDLIMQLYFILRFEAYLFVYIFYSN